MRNGRRFGAPPHAYEPPLVPEGKINSTDPDSGVMIQKGQPPMQGYNAQAAVTTSQIIVTAEVATSAPDYGRLGPVVDAALRDLRHAGITQAPTTVLADAGYWHAQQMQQIIANGVQVLVPPDSGLREGARPGWDGGFYAFMRRVLGPTTAARSTQAQTASSRCSDRSKPTDESTASNEEAGPPSGQNGG